MSAPLSEPTCGLCRDPEIGIYRWSERYPNESALRRTDDFCKPKTCCQWLFDINGAKRREMKLKEARNKDALFQETFKQKKKEEHQAWLAKQCRKQETS